ncbi:xanthine dehydrogenase family protein subunit M [Pusillimonas caeni]|uniref:FAD binding domain-containing protein n=1 Tax=Pusillimonas caeni TaxID=1348472 RepID=UPI000E599746|nr:xanthine dehydrogenase family protein subunit M [Pusillimonas caeni]TFL15563.1 xanthine dehydrogenase family protein subunit M [Pusillimonas caeni]
MYTYACTYHRPATLDDALRLAAEFPEAKFLAGGQTLVQAMKLRLAAPSDLIDIQNIAELQGITDQGGNLRLGAMTRHAEVAGSSLVLSKNPALSELAACIGDRQVRNQGTIGGSVANNDPAADYPSAMLALEATVITNRREIAAGDFFAGMYSTVLEPDELILAFSVPTPKRAAYSKFYSPASGFALTGVFVAQFESAVRVAVTGAASCVFRCARMEEVLSASFRPEALDAVRIDPAEYDLSDDLHASAGYRAKLCTVMAKRAVERALSREGHA